MVEAAALDSPATELAAISEHQIEQIRSMILHRNLGVMLSRGFGFISGAFGTAGVLRRARRVWVDVSDGQDPEKKKPGRRV